MTRQPPSDGPLNDSEGFLHRWSRRKREVVRDEPAAVPEQAPEKPALPPVESLHEGSDYAAFLHPEVDEALRRQALRRLFQLPEFNLPDGLDSDAEDFTRFAPLGETLTHEMRRQLARAHAALEEPETSAVSESAEPEETDDDPAA